MNDANKKCSVSGQWCENMSLSSKNFESRGWVNREETGSIAAIASTCRGLVLNHNAFNPQHANTAPSFRYNEKLLDVFTLASVCHSVTFAVQRYVQRSTFLFEFPLCDAWCHTSLLSTFVSKTPFINIFPARI